MEGQAAKAKLPQPLRQVSKMLTSLMSKAVELSEAKEGHPKDADEDLGPAIPPSAHSEPLRAVRCVALSSDERHLFAGLASGHVIAVSTTSGSTVATLEVGDSPIDAIAKIAVPMKETPAEKSSQAIPEEETANSEGELSICKVLVVATGAEVSFYKVSGVLEDNTFIQFATAQVPLQKEAPSSNSPKTRGSVKHLSFGPDDSCILVGTHDGAILILPFPSQTPPKESTANSPPILQLSPLFVLPPGAAAEAAGFANLYSAEVSGSGSVNTQIFAENERLRFLLRTVGVREKKESSASELYVWWEGRNRILMYEAPAKSSENGGKKAASAEPRVARQWTMPHMVTSGALSMDGTLMAVGMEDGTLLLLDLHLGLTHRLYQRLDGVISAVAFTAQSINRPPRTVVVISSGGEMKAHSLIGEQRVESPPIAVRKGVTSVTCQEGTSRALLFTNGGHVQLIDYFSGAVLGSFSPGEGFVLPKSRAIRTSAYAGRPSAYAGRHVLVQFAQQVQEEAQLLGAGSAIETPPGSEGIADTPTSVSEEASECLLFYSLQNGASLSHSDTFAALCRGLQQLEERGLQGLLSSKVKGPDKSRRPSILQASPRTKPSRHVSTFGPFDSPRDATASRHVSIHESSSLSAIPLGLNAPRSVPLLNVNKPLPLSQSPRSAIGGAFTSGDTTSRSTKSGSPKKGSLKAKGKIVGLPIAAEEEPVVTVGYQDMIPIILDKLSSKGGGRFARKQRMRQRQEEMLQELATNRVESLRSGSPNKWNM